MPKILNFTLFLMIAAAFFSCREAEINNPVALSCNLEEDEQYRLNSKSADFGSIIKAYVSRGLPGITLLVKDSTGFFIGSEGMADIVNGIPMQPCHISEAGSITGMMLGVAALRLQEKGMLSLDDPVGKYIPENRLRRIDNGNAPVTIRNLMNHTTGFCDVTEDQGFYLQMLNDPTRKWKAEELLEYVYNKEAMFPFMPDDTAGYSNTNYLLLSMVIEAVTGLPHGLILHNEVIDRLQMSDTRYYWYDPLPEAGFSRGYYDLYNNGKLQNLTQWNTGSGNGFSGIYATVWDMYLFANALFESKTLLSQASLDEMLVFHPDITDRKQFGVGCFRDFIDSGNPAQDYAWGHQGRDLAYSADLYYFPEHGTIMALLVNYGTSGESFLKPVFMEMRNKIARRIAEN